MTGTKPFFRFRQLGTMALVGVMVLGLATTARADFSDGQIPTASTGTAYGPTVTTPPGCLPNTQTATMAGAAYAQGYNNNILAARITKPGLINSTNCPLSSVSSMVNNLSSLFSGGVGDIFKGLGDKLLNMAVTAVCSVIDSTVTGAINTGLATVSGSSQIGSVLANTAGGALYGGQLGAATALTGSATNAIGSTLSGSLGNSVLGNTATSIATTGLYTGTSSALSNSGLTGATPGPSLIQQLMGSGTTATTGAASVPSGTSGTSVQPGGLY